MQPKQAKEARYYIKRWGNYWDGKSIWGGKDRAITYSKLEAVAFLDLWRTLQATLPKGPPTVNNPARMVRIRRKAAYWIVRSPGDCGGRQEMDRYDSQQKAYAAIKWLPAHGARTRHDVRVYRVVRKRKK